VDKTLKAILDERNGLIQEIEWLRRLVKEQEQDLLHVRDVAKLYETRAEKLQFALDMERKQFHGSGYPAAKPIFEEGGITLAADVQGRGA
jgi:hypothetical protein